MKNVWQFASKWEEQLRVLASPDNEYTVYTFRNGGSVLLQNHGKFHHLGEKKQQLTIV